MTLVKHKNVFESLREAQMRLQRSIVKYDDKFYYVLKVAEKEACDIYRVYMEEVGHGRRAELDYTGFPRIISDPFAGSYSDIHDATNLDLFLESLDKSDKRVIRKTINSPKFDFMPFPLGCININGSVAYSERIPTRNVNQGLLFSAISTFFVSYNHNKHKQKVVLDTWSAEFNEMLQGNYPSYHEVLMNLRDPDITNEAAAFDRMWSVLRGPLDMLFLCYQEGAIGLINKDNSVRLSDDFTYLKESIEELGIEVKEKKQ